MRNNRISAFRQKDILRIDGSQGEGGGQILRTALSLSCMLQRPFEIVNIRKARRKPGLQPQHLAAVKAAAEISRAAIEGADLSSIALRFMPGPVMSGDYYFDISDKKGSAGSTSLVLQTVMLPLFFAPASSTVTVIGGTHVPLSPPFHYIRHVFLPLLSRLGLFVDTGIETWGWYPVGGGKIKAHIPQQKKIAPVRVVERGKLKWLTGISAVSNLPREIALRQYNRMVSRIMKKGLEADIEIVEAPSTGKGNVVFLYADFENVSAGFFSLGALGKRAETVADEACDELFKYLDSSGALDRHLVDQIIPYLAFATGFSELTTTNLTKHLLTNIAVIKQFLSLDIVVEGREGEQARVFIRP